MSTNSYVPAGGAKAMEEGFGSSCHGAGRLLGRKRAIKASQGRAIERELAEKGIIVLSTGRTTLKEEIREAYKDVSSVVEAVHMTGLATKVARMWPIGRRCNQGLSLVKEPPSLLSTGKMRIAPPAN